MPIFIGQSAKNQAEIAHAATQMGKVFVGNKLVWQKTPPFTPIKFGALYNWPAATDVRNITSSDNWRVPQRLVTFGLSGDFYQLANYIGLSGAEISMILMLPSLDYWDYIVGCNNSLLFNGKGAGKREVDGTYSGFKSALDMWTSKSSNTTMAPVTNLGHNLFNYPKDSENRFDKRCGISIRLVNPFTNLANGQMGIYHGNNGNTYRTICIGAQEWMADNLAETQFRTGDNIPVVESQAAWTALGTSPGMCYPNGNILNV